MSKIDYSKWKDIEVSDDEDDTHPNIDTPSLFRWRHQARVQRMEESEREKQQHAKDRIENKRKLAEITEKIEQLKTSSHFDSAQMDRLQTEKQKLEEKQLKLQNKSEELAKKEKLAPWNVDTISKEGFTKTVINKPEKRDAKTALSEDEQARIQTEFNKKHLKELKTLGMFQKWDDTRNFLLEHPELVCEETANFFVIWCIDLEVEEKHELMGHVAHQTIAMQYLLELAKQLDVNPKSVVSTFFSKMKLADKDYLDAFNDELEAFKGRVRERAKIRIENAIKEYEAEEKQKRLGPGGLDPVEVMEQLPNEMQECFEKQDIQMLKDYIVTIDSVEAKRLMKLCVDSGLWVPDKNSPLLYANTPTEATKDENCDIKDTKNTEKS